MSGTPGQICADQTGYMRRCDAGTPSGYMRGGTTGGRTWLNRLWVRITQFCRRDAGRARPAMRVAAIQHLHGGAILYALDVDGRRLLFAAAAHWGCLLSCYPEPAAGRESLGQTQNVVSE